MSESDTVDPITFINHSDNQAIELVRFLKRTTFKSIFTASLKKALANNSKDLILVIPHSQLVFKRARENIGAAL